MAKEDSPFCGLTDEDLISIYDSWSVLSDERGFIGTAIINELVYLRRLLHELGVNPEFPEDLLELGQIDRLPDPLM